MDPVNTEPKAQDQQDTENSGSALTIGKLRTFNGFEQISDEKGEEIIKFLKRFARILLSIDPTKF